METVRTMVYLRKGQRVRLLGMSHRRSREAEKTVGLSEVLREILDRQFGLGETPRLNLKGLVALGRSGVADGSVHHDRYVAEAIGEEIVEGHGGHTVRGYRRVRGTRRRG